MELTRKKCTKCNRWKYYETDFYHNKGHSSSWCKPCKIKADSQRRRERMAADPELHERLKKARADYSSTLTPQKRQYRRKLARATDRALDRLQEIYPEEFDRIRELKGLTRRRSLRILRDQHRNIFNYLLDQERLRIGLPRKHRRPGEAELPDIFKYERHGDF